MNISNSHLDQLVIARRLLLHAQRAEDLRKGRKVDEKTAREEMEEDRVLLSGAAPAEQVEEQSAPQKTEDVQVSLSSLIARLKELESASAEPGTRQVQVDFQQVIERSASVRYSALEKVDGLVRRSRNVAETDRYRLEFSDGTTFKITDKWSNRSTTIWGDPHVDVDDVQGDRDGDFQDMTGSDSHTTLMLQDGTRVTMTARDNGIIEAVDIFKGSQHLGGLGAGSIQWNEKNGLFAAGVDNRAESAASLPMGDTVYAGGDGNDWFTSSGKLLWGAATGPAVNTRPRAVIQLEYQETISQQISVQVVNKQA